MLSGHVGTKASLGGRADALPFSVLEQPLAAPACRSYCLARLRRVCSKLTPCHHSLVNKGTTVLQSLSRASRLLAAHNPCRASRCYADEQANLHSIDARHSYACLRKAGIDILHDPLVNKGTAFPQSERERLGVRGLLPTKVLAPEKQISRFMEDYLYGKDFIDPVHVKDGGVTKSHVRRWKLLQELQDRNETLFYRVLLDNFVEMSHIVYTPTVGWACLNFHRLYRRPRGMYFSASDKGEMAAMAWNWPANQVDAIVVTDGSRILGLGDLGVNGLGIPIGKLDLYVAAAGFNPHRVLPVVIDVGTDNEQLRNDPLYMGLAQPRLKGPEYFEIVDEFVAAVMGRWPKCVLQFEDFNMATAHPLLNRYRTHHLVFNDDIQGTAATAVAGLYGALAIQGKPVKAIRDQRICVVGAGSAGMGVTRMIATGMVKQGCTPGEAKHNLWVSDKDGLVTARRDADKMSDVVRAFARQHEEEPEGEKLLDTINRVKPTALIGLAGAGRLFTPEILTAMGQHNERPIIFPMSNPTSMMECSAEDAQKYTGGRAIFASGSPQRDVEYDGRVIVSGQANNMYVFPGLAMGAHLGQTGIITDDMIMAAAEALPHLVPPEDLKRGDVYPRLNQIRHISIHVALAVMKAAAIEGRLNNLKAARALEAGNHVLAEWIDGQMYHPKYSSLIRLPTGVME
ncbi:hypothetical protein WJX72_003247 [[Myrmecia] bisecta]|uniref:Malic enzyme n=1 Tax=[Myrmecia] bisecta TaxID=41462 RepID=A0AAW1R5R8_9CHLO